MAARAIRFFALVCLLCASAADYPIQSAELIIDGERPAPASLGRNSTFGHFAHHAQCKAVARSRPRGLLLVFSTHGNGWPGWLEF
jgi:hypothetical protein